MEGIDFTLSNVLHNIVDFGPLEELAQGKRKDMIRAPKMLLEQSRRHAHIPRVINYRAMKPSMLHGVH